MQRFTGEETKKIVEGVKKDKQKTATKFVSRILEHAKVGAGQDMSQTNVELLEIIYETVTILEPHELEETQDLTKGQCQEA